MIKKILITLFLLVSFLIPMQQPVSAQLGADRPVISIDYYGSDTTPTRGQDFNMTIIFKNSGQQAATNLMMEFVPGDLIPRDNGGRQTMYQLIPGETKGVSQNFTVSSELLGAQLATVVVNINYSDYDGNVYSDSFNLAMNLSVPAYSAPVPTPTPTPVVMLRPQIVIQSFSMDEALLQPGSMFELTLTLINLGNSAAKSVSMVLGGGTVETNPEGTPVPGISGSAGDFTNFAPLESSNIKFIGDILPGESVTATQRIIVNVSTTPGAHSLDYSFVYLTENEQKVVDNQVITLLVYRLPSLHVDFYMEPGPFYANQMNTLPLQVVNLGKSAVVLGNMLIAASDAQLENNMALVGAIDPGFYFTIDTMIIPNQAGPLDVLVTVNFTDDFNQPRTFETTLTLDVMEMDMGGFEPGEEPYPPIDGPENWESPPTEETFWQKVIRVLRGLFGLDSGIRTAPVPMYSEEMPMDLP
jgi:hypothetical protein